MEAVLEAVDGGDLALTSLVGAADDHDLVLGKVSIRRNWGEDLDTYILADGNAAHSVLLAELLTQRRLKVVRTCPMQCSKSLHTLMMTRRTLLGALKCAFRDLRRELATIALTLVIFAVGLAVVGLVDKVRVAITKLVL